MSQVQNQMAIRIVKNEVLLCESCLISSAGPNDVSIYCNLESEAEVKAKGQFCAKGLWLINGEVVDFKKGFQLLHTSKEAGAEKEIKI